MDWQASADENGIIELRTLCRGGLDAAAVRRLVTTKQITRLSRGWAYLGTPTDLEHRHRLTTLAMLRSHDGRAVASYHSALVLLGVPTYGADLETVRLNRRTAGPTRGRRGLSLGRLVDPELVVGDTVHPAVAVVQVGTDAGPLAALVAADGALHRRLVTLDELHQAIEHMARVPGMAMMGKVLERADGRHASPGETRTNEVLVQMDLFATPQYVIQAPGFTALGDLVLEEERVVIEFDGMVKYGRSADLVDHFGELLHPGEVVTREKRREDRIRDLDWVVVRVTWADLADPVALRAKIEEAVRRGRRYQALRAAAGA